MRCRCGIGERGLTPPQVGEAPSAGDAVDSSSLHAPSQDRRSRPRCSNDHERLQRQALARRSRRRHAKLTTPSRTGLTGSLSARDAPSHPLTMFISKKNRIEVYSYLFKEGVLVAKKDNFKPKHDEIDVPNLEVLNLMKSLKSRGFVRETFNWQYFYWYLENEGVEYLREYLHLPAEIVPATLKKATARPVTAGGRAPPPGAERLEGEGPGFGRGFGRGAGGFGRGAATAAA